jgi:hypothetical protein
MMSIINRTLGGGIEYIDYFELKSTERLSGTNPVLTSGSSPAEVHILQRKVHTGRCLHNVVAFFRSYLRCCGDGGWGVNKLGIVGEGNASRQQREWSGESSQTRSLSRTKRHKSRKLHHRRGIMEPDLHRRRCRRRIIHQHRLGNLSAERGQGPSHGQRTSTTPISTLKTLQWDLLLYIQTKTNIRQRKSSLQVIECLPVTDECRRRRQRPISLFRRTAITASKPG